MVEECCTTTDEENVGHYSRPYDGAACLVVSLMIVLFLIFIAVHPCSSSHTSDGKYSKLIRDCLVLQCIYGVEDVCPVFDTQRIPQIGIVGTDQGCKCLYISAA